MAESLWRFTNDHGQPYLIGLFHGDKDGHLVVHCNSRVVLIDFNVQDTKAYSFFIEEELCEVKLDRQDEGFAYSCAINLEVDTPKNRWRKSRVADEKINYQQAWWIAGGVFLLIFLFSIFLKSTFIPRI
ncbi:MAG TPA: hypothetical protein PLC89_20245 [Haliscomenobacter sp.]|uniref:hypothetical protein n=1 Tax=Haliscomenobacter sp. TaxID=2717303 RepID=UPI001D2D6CDC|nr:hypothetical protein [Haliscomenobacter sp.]MBK9487435.1 hypothetical protein [Haliscomenobacter sp.]HOY19654.1 hypothetical protein [Haliscomenobacter sp.]HPH19150.1 hypothetical protein [Haliscomenobacter sp.]